MALHIQFCALFMWFIQNMQIICNLKTYYTPLLLQAEQFKTGKTVKFNDPALLIAQHKKQWVVVNMLRHKKQSHQYHPNMDQNQMIPNRTKSGHHQLMWSQSSIFWSYDKKDFFYCFQFVFQTFTPTWL
jgi:hypothetical protein